jgi:hypothetical protein
VWAILAGQSNPAHPHSIDTKEPGEESSGSFFMMLLAIRLTQSAYYKRFRRIYCKFFCPKKTDYSEKAVPLHLHLHITENLSMLQKR